MTDTVEKISLQGMNALLRFYFHIDPDTLSDDVYFQRWRELEWCLKQVKPFANKE